MKRCMKDCRCSVIDRMTATLFELPPAETLKLHERFVVPPFSVLDAKQGYWRKRKEEWKSLGIDSELGREVKGKNAWQDLSNNPRRAESTRKIASVGDGPTLFDPVLCEVIYSWFTAPGYQVLDPFAGGSVRGIVASKLGRRYTGIELSGPQVEANRIQGQDIVPNNQPTWIQGDSLEKIPAERYDFIFSCPPYFDLEVYSDNANDLSTYPDYHSFWQAYAAIICKACDRLRNNRFACFVVGDLRDKDGNYRNFVSDTITAFDMAGLALYNEAILVTSAGSLPLRVGKQFERGRKLGKQHQNVLIFIKGKWRQAVANLNSQTLISSV